MSRKVSVKARARAGEFDFGRAASGNQQIGVRIEVLQGDPSGDVQPGIYTWYGFFTEKSIDRTLEQLEIAGWNGNPGDDFMNLVGLGSTEFELQFEEENDFDEQGNPAGSYWRPTFINRAGVAMRDKMSDAEKVDFAQSLKASILARKQGSGAQRTQSSGGRPQGGGRLQGGGRPQQRQRQPDPMDDIPPPDDGDYF